MNDPILASRARPAAIIREALAFIANPHARRPENEPLSAQVKPLLVLLGLNIAVLFMLLPLLQLWNHAVGIETPKLVLDKNSPWLVAAVIAFLPPLEEIVFRGWQAGRPWQLVTLVTAIAAFVAIWLAKRSGMEGLALPVIAVAVAVILASAWFLRQRQAAPGWFVRGFRWIFWAAAMVFAAAHYSNYEGLGLAHAPLVLPQLWAGLLLGHVRLRFGLTRSMALHVSSNAAVIVISALTGWAGA